MVFFSEIQSYLENIKFYSRASIYSIIDNNIPNLLYTFQDKIDINIYLKNKGEIDYRSDYNQIGDFIFVSYKAHSDLIYILIAEIKPSVSVNEISCSALKLKFLVQEYYYKQHLSKEKTFQLNVLEWMPLAVFISELEGKIEFVNKKAVELLGYEKKELLGKNIFELSQNTEYDESNWQLLEARQSEQLILGTAFKRKDGTIFNIEAVTHFLNYNDKEYLISFVKKLDEDQNKEVFQRVLEAQNIERKRFAKDLHDGLGPLLSLIKLYISDITSEDMTQEESVEIQGEIIKLIDEAIVSAKRIANNLVPSILKEYGLVVAIKNFIAQINKNNKFQIALNVLGENTISQNAQLEVYQLVRELLNNAMKHSDAKNIFLDFKFEQKHLLLQYRDNGKGFNLEKVKKENSGMGLNNLYKRVEVLNGIIDINSELGKGTKIKIEI